MTTAIPRRRWRIAGLLAAGVLVNYFDRINLSVAGPQLQQEFGFGPAELGLLFSAFAWSYALLQIPVGLVLDRLGVRRIGAWGAAIWAAASGLTAIATGMGGLLAARVLLGVGEAPTFPANAKAIGAWFPRAERALPTAIFDAAAKFSNVIGVPVVALAVVTLGWRWGFAITALLSLLYLGAFLAIYREPDTDRGLSKVEREYLRTGGATETESATSSGALLRHLLASRKVWGLSLGFAAYGYSFYLFLTWLPGYLVSTMHMDILHSAGYAAIPWAVATITDLAIGGWLVDALIARGHDETLVRKSVLVTGMLMGLAVIGAVFTTEPRWAILWISIALGGLAFAAPVGWSIPSLIAPRGGTGTIGGIMNFLNNVMAILAPIVTGLVVQETHSFAAAFAIAGAVLLLGILSFVFLLGRIEPIPEPGTS